MLIVDTREKKWEHVKRYLDRNGIIYECRALSVGDYINTDSPEISIDRKRNLQELAGNLCTKDNSRFWREVRRAKENRIQLIVLIEQSGYKTIQDVQNWKSEYSRITGQNLARQMLRLETGYGVQFRFCHKLSTGKMICELLNVKKEKAEVET